MNHSLINNNQLRNFLIEVCDNQHDKNGMHIIDPVIKISIPLLSKGNIIYADSHAPSDEEFQTCRDAVVTSQSNWNPSIITLGRVISRYINQDISDLQAAYLVAVAKDTKIS
jgi:hypothetical protein